MIASFLPRPVFVLRRRIRHRLVSGEHRTQPIDPMDELGNIGRSLHGGSTLRQAIIDAATTMPGGIMEVLARGLHAGYVLADVCAEVDRAYCTPRTRRDRPTAEERRLVVRVIGLAQAMGGEEVRLVDSLLHTLVERRQTRHQRLTQAATAMSSMRLLTWLPVGCGLWITTESVETRRFLLHTNGGRICLVAGAILNLIGRYWSQRIIDSP